MERSYEIKYSKFTSSSGETLKTIKLKCQYKARCAEGTEFKTEFKPSVKLSGVKETINWLLSFLKN